MAESIHAAIAALPESGLTVRLLQMMDALAPGEWKNITSFEAMIREVTGEDDQAYLQEIGEHALALYANKDEGYQRAMSIYSVVDTVDKVIGAAALAGQAASKISFLSFISDLAPKDETTQAIDAAAKFAAELAGFVSLNGIPGDGVAEFAKSLGRYAHADAIRLASWITVDGVLPLGPDFLEMIATRLKSAPASALESNGLFSKIAQYLRGDSTDEKRGFVLSAIDQTGDTIRGWVAERGITQDAIASKLSGFVEMADGKLDLIAAGLDVSTNYFEHTGTQSVARQLVDRAYGEV